MSPPVLRPSCSSCVCGGAQEGPLYPRVRGPICTGGEDKDVIVPRDRSKSPPDAAPPIRMHLWAGLRYPVSALWEGGEVKAGGALPSGPVLPVQTPEQRRRAPPPSPVTHGCRSGSDRRAHLGETGDRRLGGGEDRPVRVHRWSLRSAGERCADGASPRAAPLEKLRSFLRWDTFLLSPLSSSS
ncbi:unnamed protein product [Pleuronectes platessa]|uniref:Uncharacterized protein n=1 Tax=Pleuronectes platessa TaxID=8262 RepID=A0A9N7YYE0_PLEPL|nr:unnamed protein product [Pleuronectes platessa]